MMQGKAPAVEGNLQKRKALNLKLLVRAKKLPLLYRPELRTRHANSAQSTAKAASEKT